MKTFTLLLFSLGLYSTTLAQINAITDTGDEVILYNDGTWSYLNEGDSSGYDIPVNPTLFTKSESSTFLLKSSRINLGFWLDPKVWSFKKGTENADSEYELQLKGDDLYGMIITEKVEIPLETLREVAIENARAAAPDIRVVKEEYRTVNGINILLLQLNGTIQGIKFSYYGYYYSNSNGTVQFLTYTSQNLLTEFLDTCEQLLNGLVELEEN
tara:strand:- start:17162 stop:17800 length:639 start_codon:yes stop_codon:yes gene_type:complete